MTAKPIWLAGRTKLTIPAIFNVLIDCQVMSYKAVAKRHGISEKTVSRIHKNMRSIYNSACPPRICKGIEHLAIDVAEVAGKRLLFVSAIQKNKVGDSYVVTILPYAKEEERAAHDAVARLSGIENILAISIDDDDDLIELVTRRLGKCAVYDTRHFLGTVLRPLATARTQAGPALARRMDGGSPSGRRHDGVKKLSEDRRYRLSEEQLIELDFALIVGGKDFRDLYLLKEQLSQWASIRDKSKGKMRLDQIRNSIDPLSEAWSLLRGFREAVDQKRAMIDARYEHKINTSYVEWAIGQFKKMSAYLSGNGDVDIDVDRFLFEYGCLLPHEKVEIIWMTAFHLASDHKRR